jgi:prolyl 4-hydroxylase
MQSLLPSHLISAEPFQVVHYSPGQSYTSHFDNKMGCVRRACTFMAYLSDVESGGATHFPKAVAAGTQQEGIKIMPKKGRALIFWSIVDGREDPHSLHEAETVERGSKWIVTKWLQIDQALGTLPMKRTEL